MEQVEGTTDRYSLPTTVLDLGSFAPALGPHAAYRLDFGADLRAPASALW
jgi:hypothetical protein